MRRLTMVGRKVGRRRKARSLQLGLQNLRSLLWWSNKRTSHTNKPQFSHILYSLWILWAQGKILERVCTRMLRLTLAICTYSRSRVDFVLGLRHNSRIRRRFVICHKDVLEGTHLVPPSVKQGISTRHHMPFVAWLRRASISGSTLCIPDFCEALCVPAIFP